MDNQLDRLETVLKQQTAAHERLLSLLKQKRDALEKADHDRISRCSEQENQTVQQISDLEKERLALVAELTLAIDPAAKQPMRLAEVAQRLDEPTRGRLLVLRHNLIERIKQAHQETVVLRRATEAIVRHMQGLFQMVGSAVAGSGVYNQRGNPPQQVLAVSTFRATA